MAYNSRNYIKHIRYIVDVYFQLKESDVPDTRIVRYEFPKRGIHISYRTWMKIKNMKPSDLNKSSDSQPSLFKESLS